jgi:hypothetical protein
LSLDIPQHVGKKAEVSPTGSYNAVPTVSSDEGSFGYDSAEFAEVDKRAHIKLNRLRFDSDPTAMHFDPPTILHRTKELLIVV